MPAGDTDGNSPEDALTVPGAPARTLPGGGGRMARWSSVAIRFMGRATGMGGEPPGKAWPRAAWAALSLALVVALALTVVWAIAGAGHFWARLDLDRGPASCCGGLERPARPAQHLPALAGPPGRLTSAPSDLGLAQDVRRGPA